MGTLAAAAAWRHVVAGRRGATCDVRRGDREFGVLPLLAKHFFQTRWRGVESAPIIRQVDDGSRDFQKPAPTSSRQFSCAGQRYVGPAGCRRPQGSARRERRSRWSRNRRKRMTMCATAHPAAQHQRRPRSDRPAHRQPPDLLGALAHSRGLGKGCHPAGGEGGGCGDRGGEPRDGPQTPRAPSPAGESVWQQCCPLSRSSRAATAHLVLAHRSPAGRRSAGSIGADAA
jgi:hypothetical protein